MAKRVWPEKRMAFQARVCSRNEYQKYSREEPWFIQTGDSSISSADSENRADSISHGEVWGISPAATIKPIHSPPHSQRCHPLQRRRLDRENCR